ADVVANIGVILAGALVLWLGSPYPDFVIGTLIGLYVIKESVEILSDARRARGAARRVKRAPPENSHPRAASMLVPMAAKRRRRFGGGLCYGSVKRVAGSRRRPRYRTMPTTKRTNTKSLRMRIPVPAAPSICKPWRRVSGGC